MKMPALTLWFTARSQRERLLLAAALMAVFAWLALTLVWQPLQSRRTLLEAQISRHSQALALLRAKPPVLVAGQNDARPIAVIIAETAEAAGLTVRRLAPAGEGTELTLEDAPFATLIQWLARLEAENQLLVARIDLKRLTAPGQVAATLVLRR